MRRMKWQIKVIREKQSLCAVGFCIWNNFYWCWCSSSVLASTATPACTGSTEQSKEGRMEGSSVSSSACCVLGPIKGNIYKWCCSRLNWKILLFLWQLFSPSASHSSSQMMTKSTTKVIHRMLPHIITYRIVGFLLLSRQQSVQYLFFWSWRRMLHFESISVSRRGK